jgi:hypothetical protein
VGEPLVPAPEIQLLDATGQASARAGVAVTAAVAGGAGALSGTATRLTDAAGRAVFADLAFGGLAVGVRSLSFSAVGLTGATSRTVQVNPGPPARLEAASPLDQTAGPGGPVPEPPAVLVSDAAGNPVPGTPVAFAVTAGGGSVVGSPASAGVDGVAHAAAWTLGASGSQALQATSPLLATAAVTFTATIRSTVAAYDISLRFLTTPDEAQVLAFLQAKARIEEVVRGDVPDVPVAIPANSACGNPTAIAETVDDLLILVEVGPIDGPGKILGQAGPCLIRGTGKLPIVGHMQFDEEDLLALEASGRLGSVILHEMLHVIGFGTIWTNLGLIQDAGLADPIFTGSGALGAFLSFNGGGSYAGRPIPLENTGAAGTRDAHWRESVFGRELMTGFISGATQPLSRTTALSLQDLGYTVDPAAADPFDLATALRLEAGQPGVWMEDDVFPASVQEVDEHGVLLPTGR